MRGSCSAASPNCEVLLEQFLAPHRRRRIKAALAHLNPAVAATGVGAEGVITAVLSTRARPLVRRQPSKPPRGLCYAPAPQGWSCATRKDSRQSGVSRRVRLGYVLRGVSSDGKSVSARIQKSASYLSFSAPPRRSV